MLIASGVSYRQLNAPGFAELTGQGIYYGAALTDARECTDQHVVVIGGANSAGQAAVYFSKHAGRVTMLVRGDSLAKSMSHYLIEQIEALDNVEVRTRSEAVAAEGDGRLRALRIRNPDGSESVEQVDACFVFIGARPLTDWLEGVVARDERGFILAGPRRQGRRLAASARPVPARDERARGVRRRRRPRALDQAGGERRRRGIDGGLARPPVPGRGMSPAGAAPVTVADLRPVDLFDDLDDDRARRVGGGRRAARRRGRRGRPRGGLRVPGAVLPARRDGAAVPTRRRPARAGGHQTAPTWIGAVPALTETPVSVRMVAATPVRGAVIPAADVPDARARTPARCTAGSCARSGR